MCAIAVRLGRVFRCCVTSDVDLTSAGGDAAASDCAAALDTHCDDAAGPGATHNVPCSLPSYRSSCPPAAARFILFHVDDDDDPSLPVPICRCIVTVGVHGGGGAVRGRSVTTGRRQVDVRRDTAAEHATQAHSDRTHL